MPLPNAPSESESLQIAKVFFIFGILRVFSRFFYQLLSLLQVLVFVQQHQLFRNIGESLFGLG